MSGSNCCSASRRLGNSRSGSPCVRASTLKLMMASLSAQRRVDDRQVRFCLMQIFHLRITYHADHSHPRGFRAAEFYSLADCLLSRPDAPRKRPADNGHRGRIRVVMRGEIAAGDLRYAGGVKISRRDFVVVEILWAGDFLLTLGREAAIQPGPDEGIDRGHRGALDSGNAPNAIGNRRHPRPSAHRLHTCCSAHRSARSPGDRNGSRGRLSVAATSFSGQDLRRSSRSRRAQPPLPPARPGCDAGPRLHRGRRSPAPIADRAATTATPASRSWRAR